jgi:hypothetical protein
LRPRPPQQQRSPAAANAQSAERDRLLDKWRRRDGPQCKRRTEFTGHGSNQHFRQVKCKRCGLRIGRERVLQGTCGILGGPVGELAMPQVRVAPRQRMWSSIECQVHGVHQYLRVIADCDVIGRGSEGSLATSPAVRTQAPPPKNRNRARCRQCGGRPGFRHTCPACHLWFCPACVTAHWCTAPDVTGDRQQLSDSGAAAAAQRTTIQQKPFDIMKSKMKGPTNSHEDASQPQPQEAPAKKQRL